MTTEKNLPKGLFAWFAQNHVASNLLMMSLLVGGLVTAINMTIEIFPEIDPRTITITVPYPGSTPDEVEESINRRVEEAIAGVEGIKKVRSVAAEGAGTVTAELEDHVDDREVLDDVKSEVEKIQNFPPQDADDEEIVDTSATQPVITIALYGDASERTLRELAFRIRDDLTTIEGISIANVAGVRNYEIGVEISEKALRKYNLTFAEVANAVRDFSINLPGGTIRSRAGEVLLRTDQQAYTQQDFEDLVLRTNPDGTILRLSHVASIDDGFESVDKISLFNGKPAAFVDVLQVGEQQVLDIEEKVKRYVKDLALPTGIEATTWANSADVLRSRIDLLVRNGLMGLVLVFGVLVMFLNLKLAFWTTMGIPISFLGAFLLIAAGGGTINMVSLFAFIVVLGIVVDDAIIVGESIYTKREHGLSPMRAAIEGLHEVITPVTIGILTTVIAFVPMFFTTGFLGQVLIVIPLVVISVLLMSLVEACFVLPSHLSNVATDGIPGAVPLLQRRLRNTLQQFIDRIYVPVLKHSIHSPYIIVAISITLLALTLGAMNGGYIKTIFFPAIDGDDIAARLRMPNGTPAVETERIVRHMLSAAQATRNEFDEKLPPELESIVRNISANVGSTPFSGRGGPGGGADSSSGSHFGEVKIELLAGEFRPFSASEIEASWRKKIGDIPGVELTFFSSILDAGEDINVELAHADFDQLLFAAEQLKTELENYTGVVEIQDSFEPGKPELQLQLTETGIASGLTLNNLARQVRQAYYGEEAQRVQRGRDDIEVLVRYPEKERRDIASIYDMRIRLDNGDEVPFRTVAVAKEGRGYSTIERADRRRIVSVTAKVIADEANANEINAELKSSILPRLASKLPGLSYSFEGAEKERKDSFSSLLKALAVAVLGIFAILAVQLRSYTQPLIIMSVIPIGFVGAAIGHKLLGFPVSFFSFFGIVALSGVVVNDSLILMDMINRLRSQGSELFDAVIGAARRRFRPILFTTLTTCAGLAPIITEKSLQAQFLIPMAISLAAGVAFATMITLVLVPSLYVIRSRAGERMRSLGWLAAKV